MDTIDLDPSLRRVVARVFLGRAEAELRAAAAFATVASALVELDAEPTLHRLALDAIPEERQHTRICLEVAEAYAGRPLELTRTQAWPPPRFEGASPRLRAVLRVLSQCALSETIGDAFLAHSLATTTAPLPRAALRRLMSDEIDHARIGWGLLASRCIDDELRGQIGGWLPALCELNLRSWRHRPELPEHPELRRHACCPWAEIDAVVVETFSTLILPGFAELGVDVRPAEAWRAAIGPGTPPGPLDLSAVAA